ncbi:MAG TPA: hypothetical protein VLA34_02785, partial [Candidatus Krumholzibacterium sp.]|nr:hypothetical protein [Candidatus Krumholzibacterium sp.]
AKELRKDFEREHFRLDDPVSEKARKGFIFFSIATGILFSAVTFMITQHPVYFIFGALIMITGPVLSIPLARRSREAAMNHQKWSAFRKFIIDFSAMKDAGPLLLPLWERYLVFAVAMGVAEKFLSNLRLVAAESGRTVPAAAWFIPLSAGHGMTAGSMDGLASIESLSASIGNLDSFSTALSSSSSGGGGFSGGGGGGGGGGGCGAG